VEWQEIVLELKGEMKEMQEKLAAQEAIITEINRTNAESTQNTNPGTAIEAEDTHLLVIGRRHLGRRDYVSSAEERPSPSNPRRRVPLHK